MPDNDQLLQLPMLFKDLIKRMSQEWKKRSSEDLTMSQFRMLLTLNKEGAMKAIELADILCLTPGAITGMTDKLEEHGWVARERSDEDRRVVLIQLTEAGEELVRSIKIKQRETTEAFFKILPAEDIAHLNRIFTQLLEGVEQMKEE